MPRLWEGWQVIEFGVLSISLLVGTAQGLVLALMLWRAPANRWLALLILAVSALITPYIIGFAGFYDRWPWLSFTPLSYTLTFGPLLWLYATTLCGRSPERAWPHFAPFAVQFAADALVFPFPLATKDWWDTVAHAPIIAPMLRVATFISLAVYGRLAWRCWADYRRWLAENVTNAVDFNPDWIRNFLIALGLVTLVWLSFFIANVRDPSRNYFDQFWLYVIFSGLVIYLGVEGWRHAAMRDPVPTETVEEAAPAGRDWAALGARFESEIEARRLWQDPDLTAASLARALGTNSNYLARAFNEGLGANFNAVINRRRVRQVQLWLQDPADTRAILTMAMDAGFRSKASFNCAFAEFAGMTPTQARASQARLKS
ncbi:helix-turn-helix transcriptional regulator [Sandarakinorhabdus limnophila]|jgi:AraC-like DNA-binding protein|uniref:helix-turn-helix transcriptional regulator n=1 Tax=Sandarakinorhabdus limnophila TaxID=210512 RepID=UPI0026F16A11|nr:helix-turn-helix transcriptional regulator [Sandarakinorhabdus limnophila]